MKALKAEIFIAGLCVALSACVSSSKPSEQGVIHAYTAAYSAGDVQAMAALMHPDIAWFSIEGDKTDAMAKGKDDLVKQLTDYVSGGGGSRSTTQIDTVNGPYVSGTETVTWTGEDGGRRAQTATVTYEMQEGLIRRVWYFPAVKGDRPL